jgi:putative DNA methylase
LITYKPKLIEVALPLAAINAEAAREKSIRHGHPSTLHLWWARRPLAAARAVIWASLVDDPSGDESLTEEEQDKERQRLFGILEQLVKWENSNNPAVLAEAKAEIDRCFPNGPPPILDPFGGGGAIPLEAQRLGLKALSGDLNPVAVLIQKAMIEIPPRFAGRPPVHPDIAKDLSTWERAQGLAADVEVYGRWMRDEAEAAIGHLYPDATGPNGKRLTPIAWIWARTVESPDPTWHGQVPLVASWLLANVAGKPKVWIEPVIDRSTQTISYEIRHGGKPTLERTVDRGGGRCIATGSTMPYSYIREEFRSGRAGKQLMAIVADSESGRVFLPADREAIASGSIEAPKETIDGEIFDWPGRTNVVRYGMTRWSDLYTSRQLVALETYGALLKTVHEKIEAHATSADLLSDNTPLSEGGSGATAYADAVVTYLALGLSRLTDACNSLCSWSSSRTQVRNLFGRQAIPMIWDFAENNVFNNAGGDFATSLGSVINALRRLPATIPGSAVQRDARARVRECPGAAISTDPPYYDNICYADLSDFFFVWLRRNLSGVWPDECATLLTPKADELIANRYRAGSKLKAEAHFETGMSEFMAEVASAQPTGVPATIYYAYKATETSDGAIRSTGWDTFLQGVLDAGMQVTATWPMRTERGVRLLASNSNALASSIVLACRPRATLAPLASRGEFIAALRSELPEAVRVLQSGNIAPVDLAQSTIGPGIKVFSRYAKVVESDGSSMPVSDALAIINDVLGEVLDGEEAELDRDTRFAVTWYTQNGFAPGRSGDADGQARAKNTSLAGIEDAGIGEARGGQFRLFERTQLNPDWDPVSDDRRTVWEATQYLVAALERSETEASELLHRMGGYADRARQLAYVLFQKATDKGWADEAAAYNGLITAWPALQAMDVGGTGQQSLL